MIRYFYLASNNSFLRTDVFELDDIDPAAIEITEDEYKSLFNGLANFNAITPGLGGKPTLVSTINPKAEAEAHKQYLLQAANDFINSRQWPGKAARGKLGDDEGVLYDRWLDYMAELENVSTLKPVWPAVPEDVA